MPNFVTKDEFDAFVESQNASALQKKNRVLERMMNQQREATKRTVRESYGLDVEKHINIMSPDFSVARFYQECEAACRSGKFRETEPLAAFGALLRMGINMVANSWYQLTPTVYEQIAAITPSSHAIEPYAPMHRGGKPKRTAPSEPTKEQGLIAPFDIQIMNAKFTAITSVPEEMIKWDQTGQIQERVMDIGPNMEQYKDAYLAGKFINSSTTQASFDGELIPLSATQPKTETSATWPWSVALLGGGKTRLTTYTAFTQQMIINLDTLLFNQVDANGNKLVVNPDTIFIGSGLRFPVRQLMNSAWYPSTASISSSTGLATGTDTALGTSHAENVLKGLYNPVESRYLPAKAYAIGQAHKGLVCQVASGLSVVQENPMSGDSFNKGEIRFKAQQYWEMDWLDPRFWALGSDGTV